MIFYLLIATLLLVGVLVLLSSFQYFHNWPAARLEYLRSLVTMLIIAVIVLGILSGRVLVLSLLAFLALPLVRNMLNPKREQVDEKQQEKIAGSMNRDEALRILELDEDEATADEIEKSYLRLMKLVHPDRGGTTYFAAKLNAARDYLAKNPVQ